MRTLVIDDALLDRMALNPMAVRAFPALSVIKPATSGCGRCNNKPDDKQARNAVKTGLATADTATLQTLKALLGTDRFRIFYNATDGIKDVTV